jgi:hypothetical protein
VCAAPEQSFPTAVMAWGLGWGVAMDIQTRHDFLIIAITTAVTLAAVAVYTIAFISALD